MSGTATGAKTSWPSTTGGLTGSTGTTTTRSKPRLVFLYGPPGVGKLTVARELVAATGLRLFHNHLTVDLVESIFPRGAPQFGRLIHRFRRDMLAEAAAAGIDVLFTYVYAHPEDEQDVRELIEPYREVGGVDFVRFTCSREALMERVAAESRRTYGKIADAETLRSVIDRYDVFSPVPHDESVTIDTGEVAPAEAAMRIATQLGLARRVVPTMDVEQC